MSQFSIVNSFITVIYPLEPWAPTVVTTIFIFRFGFYFARHHEYECPRLILVAKFLNFVTNLNYLQHMSPTYVTNIGEAP